MKREQRNNHVRHSRRPHGDFPVRRATNGIGGGASYAGIASRGYAGLPVAEAVGLSLVPPTRYRDLVVPLDGSAFGEHALPMALGIARRAGATVRLVQVHSRLESSFDPGRVYPDSGMDVWLRQRKRAYLDGLVRRLAKVTSVPVVPLLIEGREVATTLCEAAGPGTDLVVMATHRRGLLGRLWHGGVADALARRLTAPLLLVRGQDAPVDLTGDPVPRHALVPLDGSKAAEEVLEPALDLGALLGTDHTLLRVLRPDPDYAAGYGRVGTRRVAEEKERGEEWDYLRRLALRLGGKKTRVDARLLVAEKATAASILWYAEKHDADLIALTTKGRGPLSRLFRGSVADEVARKATTPVLVVRTAG